MKFDNWAMQQIARCTYAEGRDNMKLVWILTKTTSRAVRFYAGGDAWSLDESEAVTYRTRAEAAGRAYDMQAQFQETIVPEGVYRLANTPVDQREVSAPTGGSEEEAQ